MRTDLYLEHPAITRALATGYGYSFSDWGITICESCGEAIDDYDPDAEISDGICMCGRCYRAYCEEKGMMI